MAAGVSTTIASGASRLLRVSHGDLPEVVLRASIVGLAGLLVVVWLAGDAHGHAVLPAADLVLDTIALCVTGTLALLAWVRFRERDEPIALYHAGAFLALLVANTAAVAISLDRGSGPLTLADPEAGQPYVFAAARLLAALLLVAAGLARWPDVTRRAGLAILLLPALAVVAVAAAGPRLGSWLPPIMVLEPGSAELPAVTPFGALVHLSVAGLFLAAAYLTRANWRRQRAMMDAWVAVGLVFAGFAEIIWVMYPVGHPGQISVSDGLRLAFYIALLVGVETEARATLAQMRRANVELGRLRDADLERAALEERARLARELHDGLAQDLWLAKLRAGELVSLPELSSAARRVARETESAIDDGLAEARGAVFALRVASTPGKGFRGLLRQITEDAEDRYGIRVEFTADGTVAEVSTRTQAEILRIAQEALANVHRHADATVVRVRLVVADGWLDLSVADNGRGFDPTASRADWYGLTSMHERAALVGGELDVRSRPGDGTVVHLRVPAWVGPAAQAAAR